MSSDPPLSGWNATVRPSATPVPRMKQRTKVTDHHHTLCWSFAGHTPIQFFEVPAFGLPSSSSSSSSSLLDPRRGAWAGFSRWNFKMRSSPTGLLCRW